MHEGHRKNLRKSFISTGLEGKTEHQALELLLTYAMTRIDVNPVAHELIDCFGSLAGVMDADIQELQEIPYISENGAVLLKLIPQLSKMYHESKWKEKPKLNTIEKVKEFLEPKFMGEKNEILYMICLDNHCCLNRVVKLSEGTIDHSPVYIRDVVKFVLRTDAKNVILAHNHPSGNVRPSPADIRMTNQIAEALKPMEVKLVDHIIFSGGETYCFSSNSMLPGTVFISEPEEKKQIAEKE